MTDQPTAEEVPDPTKASKPILGDEDGGIEAFSLTFSVTPGGDVAALWSVRSEVAQAFFFKRHPIAARMLSSIVRGAATPPHALPAIDHEKKLGQLGPESLGRLGRDQVAEAILKDPRFREPGAG